MSAVGSLRDGYSRLMSQLTPVVDPRDSKSCRYS